ncbi:MAG: hypothetical protein ABIH41_01925 [Nanoarchaeota archaeon]
MPSCRRSSAYSLAVALTMTQVLTGCGHRDVVISGIVANEFYASTSDESRTQYVIVMDDDQWGRKLLYVKGDVQALDYLVGIGDRLSIDCRPGKDGSPNTSILEVTTSQITVYPSKKKLEARVERPQPPGKPAATLADSTLYALPDSVFLRGPYTS